MYDPYNSYETENSKKVEINFKQNRVSGKKSGVGTVNAGGAIVIIIFVVLCLTIFGLLSFTTSFADKKLADRNLQSVSQYYKADSQAEELLAKIFDAVDKKIAITVETNFFNEDFVKDAVNSISGIPDEVVEINFYEPYIESHASDENVIAVFYRIDMGSGASKDSTANSYLNVEIYLYYNQNTGKLSYKISEWRVAVKLDFNYDDNQIDVWNGMFE